METQANNQIYLKENIRFLRRQHGLSQEELANKVGLNRGNIASYEKGTAEPKLCNLLALSKFFDITLCDLTQADMQNGVHTVADDKNAIRSIDEVQVKTYIKQAKELNDVLEGLNCYHCYKTKGLEDLPKDMQMLVSNFEKLFDVSQELMGSHKAFLAYVQSKSASE